MRDDNNSPRLQCLLAGSLLHLFILLCPVIWLTLIDFFMADPKLPSLLKMLQWAQNQLDEKAAYPRINDLSTAILEDSAV